MSGSDLISASMLVPALAALGIVLVGRWPNVREAVTLTAAAIVALLVLAIAGRLEAGEALTLQLIEPIPGLAIAFRVEALGMIFALVAGLLWLVTSVYAIGYMRGHHEENQTRFYAAFAVSIACTLGVAFSANLLTLFLFYELLTLSTYPLVTHSGTEEARRSGRIYLGILLGTSIGLQLLGILIVWALTGTLDFREGGILAGELDPAWAVGLYALFLFGIGKAAVMPFHRWLPAAMVAPTPVSALLHAVAVVKAGVFTLLKVTLFIFGGDFILSSGATEWLIWFAAATILLASLVAMTKDNLKARLAYSTVSQLSYILLGAMLASRAGMLGGALHIVMHAFAKITLFFGAGAILVAAHKTKVSELDGLGRAMPLTFAAFLIGTLSIIGLPPFGGMWSKLYLGLGAMSGEHWALLGVLMVSSLLNIAYLLPIPIRAFLARPPEGEAHRGLREAPMTCLLAMAVTSLACVLLFFYPDPFYRLAAAAVGAP